MSIEFSNDLEPVGADWRLRFSLGLTIVWLVLGFTHISGVIGWTDFVRQNAPSLGSFLEGAFAPLAFLWLVVGFFLQQKQLTENTKTIQMQLAEMRRTAEQAEVQSRAIAADELHSRQDTFMRVVEVVKGLIERLTRNMVLYPRCGRVNQSGTNGYPSKMPGSADAIDHVSQPGLSRNYRNIGRRPSSPEP